MTSDKTLGRRPGTSGTREAIAAAARRQFAASGYDRTSLRSIAREADVDPALVSHFFGTKQQLFAAVVELPFDPQLALAAILAGEPGGAGVRLARFFLSALDRPEVGARFTAMVRAAATEPEAARLVREQLVARVIGPIAEHLGSDDLPLRVALVGSQLVGLVIARRVVAIEPLASADADELVTVIGATLQRYLTGPLDGS